jgi:hypothetical protein
MSTFNVSDLTMNPLKFTMLLIPGLQTIFRMYYMLIIQHLLQFDMLSCNDPLVITNWPQAKENFSHDRHIDVLYSIKKGLEKLSVASSLQRHDFASPPSRYYSLQR